MVVATDKVSPDGLGPLVDDPSIEVVVVDDSGAAEFDAALQQAVGLIVRSATTVDRGLLERAPKLKVVGRAGVGVDNIDLVAASDRGVAVMNAPGGNTIAAAELTVALILAVARNVAQADRSVRGGEWNRAAFKGIELRAKTLGLVGAGRIGAEVAHRCKAFGMGVIVFDPYLDPERAGLLDLRLTDLDEVLTEADVISLHVPLNDETRGMISDEALARMKPTALVVNVSRGGVVDEDALVRALTAGEIAGAGLDVFATEPLPADSPLRTAPNLVLTPHLGASTAEAQVSVADEVARYVRAALVDGDYSAALPS